MSFGFHKLLLSTRPGCRTTNRWRMAALAGVLGAGAVLLPWVSLAWVGGALAATGMVFGVGVVIRDMRARLRDSDIGVHYRIVCQFEMHREMARVRTLFASVDTRRVARILKKPALHLP